MKFRTNHTITVIAKRHTNCIFLQWLGFTAAAQSMLNVDFDTMGADSILNLTLGSGNCDDDDDDSPASKAKSMFEMFCNEKSNSFDEDEEDEDDEDSTRKKNSFDLSSPDSDSLDEDKWTDVNHSPKVNFDMNLFNSSGGGEEDIGSPGEDDIFSLPPVGLDKIGGESGQNIPSVLGADPWSNLEPVNNNSSQQLDEDPWSNPDLLFNSAAASGALEEPGASIAPATTTTPPSAPVSSNIGGDWAKFDKTNSAGSPEKIPSQVEVVPLPPQDDHDVRIGDEEEWANFESAAFPLEEVVVNKKDDEDKKTEDVQESSILSNGNDNSDNVAISGGSNSNSNDVVVAVDLESANDVSELQEKFQSPPAKDETVSSAQQELSASN